MSQSSEYVPRPKSESSSLYVVLILVVGALILFGFLGAGAWMTFVRARQQAEMARQDAVMQREVAQQALLEATAATKQVRAAAAQAASPAAAEASTDITAQVDELLAKYNRPDVPGCAVGIVQRGELIYSKGFGTANLEHRVANTPQTVFETASFAKMFTCLCLALLMDEDKISPEDDVRKFIPELHPFDPPIRVQDMVRCRSGLWDQISIPIVVGWENAPRQFPVTLQDTFDLLIGQKRLPFAPGTQFRYSSGDYFLLSMIIERVSGLPLPEYARQRVFEPLGMTRTSFEEDSTRVLENRAVGHYKPHGSDWHLWQPTGGGGLKTCVEDLYRWDQNVAQNALPSGRYLDELLEEGTLLGNRNCLDVDANRKENDPQAASESPPGQYRGVRRRQFTGGAWGFTTAMSQFPDQELTAICLSNSDDVVAWNINSRIADLFLAEHLKPKRASAPPVSELPTFPVEESQLRDKVGAYRMKRTNMIWRISFEEGALRLIDHLLKTHPLRPLSEKSFDPEGPFYATTRFIFSRADDKAPWAFTSQWDEPENRGSLEFERVELVEPTPEELNEYGGVYVSDELGATYRLEVRGRQLWLRVNSRRWQRLDATVRDEFVPHQRETADGRILTFQRNDVGAVTGLAVDYYRVNGVRFAKQP